MAKEKMDKLDFIKTEDFYMTKDTQNKAKRHVTDFQDLLQINAFDQHRIKFIILGGTIEQKQNIKMDNPQKCKPKWSIKI